MNYFTDVLVILRRVFQRRHQRFVYVSGFVQFLPLISAPILTRLYSPESFGIYAIFYVTATILSSSVGLTLHNAILTEKNDINAFSAGILTFSISMVLTFSIFLIFYFIPSQKLVFFLGDEVLVLLPIMFLTVLINSFYNVFYTWAIRRSKFDSLSLNKIILGLSTTTIQIIVGLLGMGALGLVLAQQ